MDSIDILIDWLFTIFRLDIYIVEFSKYYFNSDNTDCFLVKKRRIIDFNILYKKNIPDRLVAFSSLLIIKSNFAIQ